MVLPLAAGNGQFSKYLAFGSEIGLISYGLKFKTTFESNFGASHLECFIILYYMMTLETNLVNSP